MEALLLIKLGAGLGLAWGLILTGCMINMPQSTAFQFAALIFLFVIAIAFFIPQYLNRLHELEEQDDEEGE